MGRATALALFAMCLAQVPWLHCHGADRCVPIAAIQLPAAVDPGNPDAHEVRRGHHAHGHSHRHPHAHPHPHAPAPKSDPGSDTPAPAPHDPDDHDHEIVMTVALPGAGMVQMDAPSYSALAGWEADPELAPERVVSGAPTSRARSTGPPRALETVLLLL